MGESPKPALTQLQKQLGKLGRFSWTLHNVVGHPLKEILFQAGFKKVSTWIHNVTIPEEP